MIEAIIARGGVKGRLLTALLDELLAEDPGERPTAKNVKRRCEAAKQQEHGGSEAAAAAAPAATPAAKVGSDVDVQLRIEAQASMEPVALMTLVTQCITESLPGANIAQLTCFTSPSGTPTVDVGLNLPSTPGRESGGNQSATVDAAGAELKMVELLLHNELIVSAKGTTTHKRASGAEAVGGGVAADADDGATQTTRSSSSSSSREVAGSESDECSSSNDDGATKPRVRRTRHAED